MTNEDAKKIIFNQWQAFLEDNIDREAVIKNIKGWFDKIELNPDILIDSIITLPSVTPRRDLAETSQDCISREEVQDLISRWLSDYLLDETREALETINYKVGDMPSVTPKAEPCEDCISILNRIMEYTYGMLTAEKIGLQHLIKSMIDEMSGGGEE